MLSGVAERQRTNLHEAVLAMNAYAASGQAAAVLYQLRDYSEIISRAARRVKVTSMIDSAATPFAIR